MFSEVEREPKDESKPSVTVGKIAPKRYTTQSVSDDNSILKKLVELEKRLEALENE